VTAVIVFSYAGKGGTVYSVRPDSAEGEVTFLQPEPATARPGMQAYLPADCYRNENDFVQAIPARKAYQYIYC
jgi:hypothetical protein